MKSSLQVNPEIIQKNQLNTSKTKMQYSFGQSDRFPDLSKRSISPPKFYDVPDLWKKKGTSLGYGEKVDLGKLSSTITPSPNSYHIRSFSQKRKNQGITMRQGRQDIKNGTLFLKKYPQSPTATTYEPNPNYHSRAFSIGKKLTGLESKWQKNVPGPGNYDYLSLTNERSQKMVSKYKTTQSNKFGRMERPSLALNTLSPGSGRYDTLQKSYGQSQFNKPYASRFGKGKRRGLSDRSMQTPGPGQYETFSTFLR